MSGSGESDGGPRIGVYVCRCGGNISGVVDVEKVAEAAGRLPGVVVARTETFLCSDPGQTTIVEDIGKERLDRVVVAACSPSLHELTFRATIARAGLNPWLYEHANVREQVSWCSGSDPEGATDKATRLVSAAVAKARLLEPLEPLEVPAVRHVVVIGGGIAGLRAARDLEQGGLGVTLVERSAGLGGRVIGLGRTFPRDEPGHDLVRSLVDAVTAAEGIEVLLASEVTGVSGAVGDFRVRIRGEGGGEVDRRAGAIVLATGFRSYEPRPGELGFGEHPGVITLAELDRRLAVGGPDAGDLGAGNGPVRSICFIHCVGSRQLPGVHEPGPDGERNEHCSRVCCTATLRAAREIRERFPEIDVYDVHRDIRTYGRGHEEIYEAASASGVVFLRHEGEEPPVVTVGDGSRGPPLSVDLRDRLTFGEEVAVPADLVVLATGIVPGDIGDLVRIMKLPRSPDRFLKEVHPKLRPVELAIEGVFVAGACQAPMDIGESAASAQTAVAKVAGLLGSGVIALDPYVARIDPSRCDSCGVCVEECRFVNAIAPADGAGPDSRPAVNPAICRGCGICVPVCPNDAIRIKGWNVAHFDAMVDALLAVGGGVE